MPARRSVRRCNKNHENSTARENRWETKSGFLRLIIGKGVVRACVLRARHPCFFADGPNLRAGLGDSRDEPGRDAMTNSSLFTADRTTHLKIVVVSLLASIAVMVVGVSA